MRAILLALSLTLAFPASAELKNQLLDNPSPYLAMHGHDPVHWQTWGKQVFEIARR